MKASVKRYAIKACTVLVSLYQKTTLQKSVLQTFFKLLQIKNILVSRVF